MELEPCIVVQSSMIPGECNQKTRCERTPVKARLQAD